MRVRVCVGQFVKSVSDRGDLPFLPSVYLGNVPRSWRGAAGHSKLLEKCLRLSNANFNLQTAARVVVRAVEIATLSGVRVQLASDERERDRERERERER